ncbi:aldehyde dehydrogenase (NAD+) [Rhodothermus profundi]|uniref:Aldehyde dehydrogenase n=2 Tax=Rhodothermus profundi TaxID=633813 RepID=A0A1M6VFR5_9BACT|nr:aldehyde dehydrogenase (NAD+) [Rhodothermus profundi]
MTPHPSAMPCTPELARTMAEVFERQRQHHAVVRNRTVRERRRQLIRLREAVLDHRETIRTALWADFRKPPLEVDLTEIAPVVTEARYVARHLAQWMRPKRVSSTLTHLGTRAEIRYEPKGVVLILSPWNYPFTLTLAPLITAIAAGNCVIVKPSELAPNSARTIRRILEEVFEPEEVAVFEGDHTVAEALLELPFNHIFFTGSPRVGRLVMEAAARHLASVTLELGGKSPTIVDETADVDQAAEKIAWGKFTNGGQTCIAPDYVLVHRKLHDALVDALREQIVTFYGPDPETWHQNNSYAHIVNDRHYERLRHLYEDALARGAQDVVGGPWRAEDRFVPPTVLTHVPDEAAIMQEEIFGPLLPIQTFDHLEEALAAINRRPTPLALYVFARDEQRTQYVLNHTSAGGGCVNDTLLHFNHPSLPFGGIGQSGVGKAYRYHGFLAFSNERPVVYRRFEFPLLRRFYPPYGEQALRLLNRFLPFF